MQNGFTPMAHPLLDEHRHRIDLQPLSAPPKCAVWWRIAPANDVDPEGLLGRRLQQIYFYLELLLLRELVNPRKRPFDRFCNRGDLHAGVSTQDYNRFLPLILGDLSHDLDYQGGEHRAVFTAAEAEKPRSLILGVEARK